MRSRVRALRGDAGNALVEFSWLGILLLVPVGYLMVSVFQVQRAAFGVTQATREAGRAYLAAGESGAPDDAAFAAAELALRDQGLELEPGQLRIVCSATPCLTAGESIEFRIDTRVALPFVPKVFGAVAASVAIHARHDEVVDCFRADVVEPDDAELCP